MKLARLTVDLDALCANYRLIAAVARHGPGAVVKADGYGLGAIPVARALVKEGCEDFFVATTEEGVDLRQAIRNVRIYVFSGPVDDHSAAAMAEHDLTPVLNDAEQIVRWRRYRNAPAAVHVDTGMNRLGFAADSLEPALFAGLDIRLLLSHLANADEPVEPMNVRQVERFNAVRTLFPGVRASLGNSAGALGGAVSDLARPGIGLYGGNPFGAAPSPMQPVASLKAKVIALRNVAAGQPVGYGGTYITDGETRVAVLGIGYADGLPRRVVGAEAAYQGTRLPIVGRVSMDLVQIDATPVADAIALGDWVEVFGHVIAIDEVAAWAGTISYEVLTGIGRRVHRCYIGD